MTVSSSLEPAADPSPLRRFVDAWCAVREPERDGRLYERMGLRAAFQLIARLFGEQLPPASWEAAPAQADARPEEWARISVRSRYHELLNLIALVLYTPWLVWLLLEGRSGLAAYCLLLMLTHTMALLLERYKRARALAILAASGAGTLRMTLADVWRPQAVSLPPILVSRTVRWYMATKRFETDRLYRLLGLGLLRRFVLMLLRETSTDRIPPGQEDRFIKSRADLCLFEKQTRIAEATHLAGMLLHIPFVAGVVLAKDRTGGVYVAFMLVVNLLCVLLQRWHRVRIWPAIVRMDRAETSLSGSPAGAI